MMTPVLALTRLPSLRAVLLGHRWERHFDVRRVARRIGRHRIDYCLVVDLYPDVAERVLEFVRFDLPAQWSDPRERLGLN